MQIYNNKIVLGTGKLTHLQHQRISHKLRIGVPIEYIAIQYNLSLKNARLLGAYCVQSFQFNYYRAKDIKNRWWESFIFFWECGTPVVVMARLYSMPFRMVLDLAGSQIYKYYLSVLGNKVLPKYKKGMHKDYFKTEAGKLRMQQVKSITGWKD